MEDKIEMQSKLEELILTGKEFTNKSEVYYVEIGYNGGLNRIEVAIRIKKEHSYAEIRQIYLENNGLNKIDELIEFIKSYEVKAC